MLKRLTEISFLLLVVSLPFANVPSAAFERYHLQPTELLFLITGLLFAASVAAGKIKIRAGKTYLFAGAYLLFVAISAIFSQDRGTSLVKALGITYLISLALLAFNLFEDTGPKRIIFGWLAATLIASLFGVLVAALFYVDRGSAVVAYGLSHYGSLPPGDYPRVRSTFLNANMFAHYLAISWVILLIAAEKEWISKAVVIAAGVAIAAAAALTISPGIGGICFCSAIWVGVRRKGRSPVLAAACLFAVSLLFLAATVIKPNRDMTPGRGPSARVLTWTSAAATFARYPLTGKGVGTNAADVRYEGQRLRDAHNIFLNVAAESGFPAIAVLTAFSIWLVYRGFRKGSRTGGLISIASGLAIAFSGAFFYQGMTGSFEDARHLWVLAGLLAAAGGDGGSANG